MTFWKSFLSRLLQGRCPVLCLCILLVFILPVKAQVGSTGFNLLTLAPEPRSVALGESFSALADSVATVYWNPAGIPTLSGPEVSANYRPLAEAQVFNLQGAFPLPRSGVGFDFSYLSFGDLPVYEGGQQTQTASPYELSLGVSGAVHIVKWLYLGINVKWLRQELLPSRPGDGFSFDVGLLFYRPFAPYRFFKHLSLSLVGAHLGRGPRYFETATDLPSAVRMGLAYSLPLPFKALKTSKNKKLSKLNISLDVAFTANTSVKVGGGVEWHLLELGPWDVALRAGYKLPADENVVSGLGGGAGLGFRNFQVNYSFASQGALGFDHFVGVRYLFATTQGI